MIRLLWLVAGYVFGLLPTGYLLGKAKNVDLKNTGSGNTGATNTLRVMGKKAGIFVFIIDLLKAFIPTIIAWAVYHNGPEANSTYVYMMYAAAGAVLGHNFPFFMGFKGGKGMACTAGWIMAVDWRMFVICFILFLAISYVTKYVSVGSIAISIIILIFCLSLPWLRIINVPMPQYIEYAVIVFLLEALAVLRHRSNIVRLINGTENKMGSKNKSKES